MKGVAAHSLMLLSIPLIASLDPPFLKKVAAIQNIVHAIVYHLKLITIYEHNLPGS